MSSRIAEYEKKKQERVESRRWHGMIGKPYDGGGGGVGKVHAVALECVTVYYQESNGSTNYHSIPKGLKAALGVVIKDHLGELIQEALERQAVDLQIKAGHALDYIDSIKKDVAQIAKGPEDAQNRTS